MSEEKLGIDGVMKTARVVHCSQEEIQQLQDAWLAAMVKLNELTVQLPGENLAVTFRLM